MSSFTLRTLLRGAEGERLAELFSAWRNGSAVPAVRAEQVAELGAAMADEDTVEQRLGELPKKLADMLESFLGGGAAARGARDVHRELDGAFRSRYEVEATLAALHRAGFLFRATGADGDYTDAGFAVPGELVDCIARLRRRQQSELADRLTLRGFLNARYFDRQQRDGDPDRGSEDHARKVYKLYLMERSIGGRIDKLPVAVRAIFDVAVHRFGGLMPARLIPAELEVEVDLDQVKKSLEEAMLGTVAQLRLARFGIRPTRATVIVFHEIALLRMQAHAHEHPIEVEQTLDGGVDLVGNIGRFLHEVAASKVQFTVAGQLYKASERRIAKQLLPIDGGYLELEPQLRLIYRFCLARHLIDRSGERALRPTLAGRGFEQESLLEKLRALLAFAVEERGGPGEHYHQARLRRILLRLLKRLEPECWHETLYLPFVTRNTYLTNLDGSQVEEYFAARFRGGGYVPTEDLDQLSRNLLGFVKTRLYPLGLVELGLRGGRPVAFRLSRLGAELLGAERAGDVGGERSSAVVNPDFEIILFPGDDEHEAVHALDRFAERVKSDQVYHFRLTPESLRAALEDGMTVADVIESLTDRCRAPLPQNVRYSLDDWAEQAGMFTLEHGGVLRARRAEQIDRLLAAPRLRELIGERAAPTAVRVADGVTPEVVESALRELGIPVERRT